MHPAPFHGQTTTIARNQSPYLPVPAHVSAEGVITCCWHLTWAERWWIFWSGRIWHQVKTFRQPLQPQHLTVSRPEGIGQVPNVHSGNADCELLYPGSKSPVTLLRPRPNRPPRTP